MIKECCCCGFPFEMNTNICRECLVSFWGDLPTDTDPAAIETYKDPDKRRAYQDLDVPGRGQTCLKNSTERVDHPDPSK